MTMDMVDEMLIRIGDHSPDIQHYSVLRQRLRREFGGLYVNPALHLLEETIDTHLHMLHVKHWDSVGFTEGAPERELCVSMVDRDLFEKCRNIHGNNLAAACLLHAAVLRQVGICDTMWDEFVTLVNDMAEAMA